jgi:hypothetical protein
MTELKISKDILKHILNPYLLYLIDCPKIQKILNIKFSEKPHITVLIKPLKHVLTVNIKCTYVDMISFKEEYFTYDSKELCINNKNGRKYLIIDYHPDGKTIKHRIEYIGPNFYGLWKEEFYDKNGRTHGKKYEWNGKLCMIQEYKHGIWVKSYSNILNLCQRNRN